VFLACNRQADREAPRESLASRRGLTKERETEKRKRERNKQKGKRGKRKRDEAKKRGGSSFPPKKFKLEVATSRSKVRMSVIPRSEHVAAVAELESDLREALDLVEDMRADNGVLQGNFDTLRRHHEELTQRAAADSEHVRAVERENTELEQQVEDHAVRIRELELMIETRGGAGSEGDQSSRARAEASVQRLHERREAESVHIEHRQQLLMELESSRRKQYEAQRQLEVALQEVEQLKAKRTAELAQRKGQHDRELNESHAETRRVQAQLASAEAALSERVPGDADIRVMRQQIQTLVEEAQEVRSELHREQAESAAVRSRQDSAARQADSRIAQMREELDGEKQTSDRLRRTLQSCREELAKALEEQEGLTRRAESQAATFAETRRQLQRERDSLQRETESRKHHLSAARRGTEAANARATNERVFADIEQQQKQMQWMSYTQHLQHELQNAHNSAQRYSAEADALAAATLAERSGLVEDHSDSSS
jgi:chromosome segregation ATPase